MTEIAIIKQFGMKIFTPNSSYTFRSELDHSGVAAGNFDKPKRTKWRIANEISIHPLHE